MANPYFNATYYLSKNPDVFAAGINTVEGAWNHYVTYGAREALEGADSRQPAAWFDAEYYLVNNSDLAIAGLTPGQLFEHFTTHGIGEGRAPSADVKLTEANLLAYAKANTDLLDAFDIDPDAEELTPTEYQALARHFYQYGYYEDRPAKPVGGGDTPVDNMFFLSPESDYIIGTGGDDQFLAYLSQNPGAGGVSNTLSSGDYLDGVAGYDSLFAEVVPEFFGASGGNQIEIQPRTKNIEQVEFEAREFGWSSDEPVVVDAKHMYGVERIGSKQSDGDLVIENLTTLANDGVTKRNTSALTITMDHTDNFNSDDDASDLTVYFDDNYLIAGKEAEGTAYFFLLDMDAEEQGLPPLNRINVDGLRFQIGDSDEVITLRAEGAHEAKTHEAFVAALQDALNELIAEGKVPAGSTLTVDSDITRVYKHPDTGNDLPAVPAIVLNTGDGSVVTPVGFWQLQDLPGEFAVLGRFESEHDEQDQPVSVNIELTKVGRGGDGGDLIVGAKSLHNGIEQFDVTVNGNKDLPNSLGVLGTTGGALDTINVTSAPTTDGTYASLEIREGFGEDQDELQLFNASAFKGNLTLGTDWAIENLRVLNATGGGHVEYVANFGRWDGPMDSLGNLNFSAVTAGGDDKFDLFIENGAQVTVNSGDGNDVLKAFIRGTTDSGSKSSSLTFTATGGDNVVTVDGVVTNNHGNWADVTTGGGADTVTGNSIHLTARTGAGDDVIYAENTGWWAVGVQDADESRWNEADALTNTTANGTFKVYKHELLHGREIQITLALPGMDAEAFKAGFEVTTTVLASEGFLTTTRDLYQAVANAINGDKVLNKIAEASVTSNGRLVIEYKVDGEAFDEDIVEIEVLDDWGDLSTAQQKGILEAVKAKLHQSNRDDDDIITAYNALEEETDYIATTVSGTNSPTNGKNVVNGGLGDDVIVLSSYELTSDTIEFDAGGFGNDTIVHFTAGTGNGSDVLDFTDWLDNVVSASDSVASEIRILTKLVDAPGAVTANNVVVVDFTQLGFGAGVTFDDMDEQLLYNQLNAAGGFTVGAADAKLVGTEQKSLFMIENNANDGEYKVFEVTSTDEAGENFTAVKLVGTLDFGETQAFAVENFANFV